jgi:large conductance mechanosensitive channel
MVGETSSQRGAPRPPGAEDLLHCARIEDAPVVGLGHDPAQALPGLGGGDVEHGLRHRSDREAAVPAGLPPAPAVDPQTGQGGAVKRTRDVDHPWRSVSQAPPPGSGAMAEHRLGPGVQERGDEPPLDADSWVSDCVDPWMELMQVPGPDGPGDARDAGSRTGRPTTRGRSREPGSGVQEIPDARQPGRACRGLCHRRRLRCAALLEAFIADLITPIIALIFGQPNFGDLSFTINSSHFLYGDFINYLITFVVTALVIFLFVVKPYNALVARRAQDDPDEKECRECTSTIPVKARRCPECTAQLTATA